jgi:MoaA/NifB/PqqE/SkfB family radical SAM enzyme
MINSHYLYFLKHNIKNRLLRTQEPLLASFKLTYRCNLRCRSCPFWKMPSSDMPYETAIQRMDSLHKMGVRLLIFEGGEPFLWRDGDHRLNDLVRYAKDKFYCTGMTTNGTLPLDTPADVIWVSLDGLRESHNANRGDGVFEKVITNIRASTHPRILVNVTVNRLNVRDIPALVRSVSDDVKGFTTQFHYPYPESEDLSLTHEQRVRVLEQMLALKHDGYPVLNSRATLEALKENRWKCHPWLIANVEPDGDMHTGCYVQHRTAVACDKCGFAVHTEISKAYDWNWEAIVTGRRIFGFRII